MRVPRPLIKIAAVAFLSATAVYSAAIIYYNPRRFPSAELGLTGEFDSGRGMRASHVDAGSAADRAGLRAGDRILAVNGRPLTKIDPFWNAVDRGQPGATVRLSVQRPDEAGTRDLSIALDKYRLPIALERTPMTSARIAALILLSLYPIPFLIVASVVLIQRYDDRHAWVLAVLLAGFIAGVDLPTFLPVVHPLLRQPLAVYWGVLALVPAGAFYWFFATFPEPTPFDRKLPWLKSVLLGFPLAIGTLVAGWSVFGRNPVQLSPERLGRGTRASVEIAFGIYSLSGYGLGLAALVWSSFRARPEIRRRTRVMLWGMTAGLLPAMIVGTYAAARNREFIELPFWIWVGALMAFVLIPLSFAYAVVKHRVMEIPVLLRRSARYVMVRHAIVVVGIAIGATLTLVFAWLLPRVLPVGSGSTLSAGPASGMAGALFGVVVALLMRGGVRKATDRLDRAFFRESYDARRLLQDLARRTRAATDRYRLAELLADSISDALHPSTILVLLRTPAGSLEPVAPPAEIALSRIDADAVDREAMTKTGAIALDPGELPASLAALAVLQPDLLAPMQGHDERVEGLLVLGPRLSDEPYGREDRELVASVASQAGTALQNLRLAGAIAERMEAERRAGHELEIAREVQAKLLPQHAPALSSLDYAGICIQARQVGGDYYDFLYLGPGRLGLILADISGKGISAALLMASLQASLRSRYAQAPDDLPQVLSAVNQNFYSSTASNLYATLFFGLYDESTTRLHYANCGHVPPVVLSRDGTLERLAPTGPAIGLFEEWSCATRDIELRPNDTLAMFTDGVVEAFNGEGEEFGEERLVEMLRQKAPLAAAAAVEAVADAVQRHCGQAQSDDFTLVVVHRR